MREVPGPEEPEGGSEAAPDSSEAARKNWLDRLRGRHETVERTEDVGDVAEVKREAHEILGEAIAGVERWGEQDQAHATEWFGDAGPETRERLRSVLPKIDAAIDGARLVDQSDDSRGQPGDERCFAYVHPDDPDRTVYLGEDWYEATGVPPDSRAGILVHEVSHFADVAGTGDEEDAYGQDGSRRLAQDDPTRARECADNLEYFVEAYRTGRSQSEG